MAIDGRDIARARDASKPGSQPPKQQGGRDAYESRGVGLLSHALVWVPLALIVWFAYVSGTWIGGPVEGFINVGLTVLTVAGIWGWRAIHKKRK